VAIRAFTAADGLPRDQVRALLADSHGFLWLGTQEGLARFDGVRVLASFCASRAPGASAGDQQFRLSYIGGTGNDVVITPIELTYFLSEGSTGAFFDTEIAIANPHPAIVPSSNARCGGAETRATALTPRRRAPAWRIDGISPKDRRGSSSRSCCWQSDAAEQRGDRAIPVGRRGEVVKTYPLAALSRQTISAGDVPELAERSFGALIESNIDIVVERALYANVGAQVWGAGTNATGTRLPQASPKA
jgi:hypothetical protein